MQTTVPAPPAIPSEAELTDIMIRWSLTPPPRTTAPALWLIANADIARLVAAVRALQAAQEPQS